MRKFLAPALAIGLLTSAANAVVVWDQIGADPGASSGGNGFGSQIFEAANQAFNVAAIDDFATNQPLRLTKAEGVFFGFNQPTGVTFSPNMATQWTVSIFSQATGQSGTTNAATMAGDVKTYTLAPGAMSFTTFTPVGSVPLHLVSLALPNDGFVLPTGNYWLGIMPSIAFTGNGQAAELNGTIAQTTPLNARQINPGNGFGSGTNFPSNPPSNLQYRLNGDAVPEPASLGLVALGALTLVRRRRA